jgi:hypothetical protein
MDSLDRMFRLLVSTIRTAYPQYLERPFEVAELHQTILPYRHHRLALGLETNQDYEFALLELLSGARGYLVVEDRMRDQLSKIIASPNPDPAAFRDFARSHVALSPEAVSRLDAAAATAAPATSASHATPDRTPETDEPDKKVIRSRCQYCQATLPVGRPVTFCPHCGQNVTVVNCAACGAELEAGWRFCTTCGRPTGRS